MDDLLEIATYTTSKWGRRQARRYGRLLKEHFQELGGGFAKTRALGGQWSMFRASRCQHHLVISHRKEFGPLLILAVFHENMNLFQRLHERLEDEPPALESVDWAPD